MIVSRHNLDGVGNLGVGVDFFVFAFFQLARYMHEKFH
jgi:hypothetical protein